MKRINGKPGESVSAADRGLLYGDGVFETMRCVKRRIPLFDRHLARLQAGLERLGIPGVSTEMLRAEAEACASERGSGIVKLIVTRGEGGRGYRPPADIKPTVIAEDFPLPDWPAEWFAEGIRVRTCSHRLVSNDPLAGMKTLNRLPQVLARAEWNDPEIAEGLMLDGNGRVVTGTMSNVFFCLAEQWHTPPVTAGVHGVMRGLLLDHADIREAPLAFAQREHIEAMFICNSVFGVMSVRRWDDMQFSSGTMPAEFQQIVQATFRE